MQSIGLLLPFVATLSIMFRVRQREPIHFDICVCLQSVELFVFFSLQVMPKNIQS